MMLTRWNPNRELASLHGYMDQLFSDIWGSQTTTQYLPLDVKETEGSYQISAPVPGFTPEQVEVTFQDGVLTIKAERQEQTENQDKGQWLRREISYGNFFRQIALPRNVVADDITASFQDGVLTVEVPKVPAPQPKKIQVASSGSGGSKSGQKQLTGSKS
jgi:HSP20 family protein